MIEHLLFIIILLHLLFVGAYMFFKKRYGGGLDSRDINFLFYTGRGINIVCIPVYLYWWGSWMEEPFWFSKIAAFIFLYFALKFIALLFDDLMKMPPIEPYKMFLAENADDEIDIAFNTWAAEKNIIPPSRSYGWGNGYVVIPRSHPLHGQRAAEINARRIIDVIGGITTAEPITKIHLQLKPDIFDPEDEGKWLLGFSTRGLCLTDPFEWDRERVANETAILGVQLLNISGQRFY